VHDNDTDDDTELEFDSTAEVLCAVGATAAAAFTIVVVRTFSRV
jgi:hypothetical protein